jgi:PEP-CTERM motif
MKKKFLSVLVTGLFFLCMTGMANADLIPIGTAQFSGVGTAYNLIWDDDNNGNSVIWLDYSNDPANWSAQNLWAGELDSDLTYNLNSAYTVAWDDAEWRLPNTVDGTYVSGYDGTTTGGYNITNSEMGHLFYTELGNTGYINTDGTYNTIPAAPDYFLQNTGDFDNLIASWYWSGTGYAGGTDGAWVFGMGYGYQYDAHEDFSEYGLAVRSGQVSADPIPEPATMLLFSTGLAGIAVLRRKRKGNRF